jgi:N-acetylneuraminate synthase
MRQQVYVIAEAGVNHNGSLATARELIEKAKECGANAVKFQTFKADDMVSKSAPKAEYQKRTTDVGESQYEMIKRLELSEHAHEVLIEHCSKVGIEFLTSPFDIESLKLLTETFSLPLLKIPSGEVTNSPFLLQVARTARPIILSTGMCSLGEVEQALGVLAFGYSNQSSEPSAERFVMSYRSSNGQLLLKKYVRLMHCTTEYPTPFEDVNLNAMMTLKTAFNLPVGLSDHTTGVSIPIAAVAMGATMIEKHFTLDCNLPGPDHRASLEPEEFKYMIRSIRQVESAQGSGLKFPSVSETINIPIVRKSLVAKRLIMKGETFTESNLGTKRPGSGLSPTLYWDYLGTFAHRDFDEDEAIH